MNKENQLNTSEYKQTWHLIYIIPEFKNLQRTRSVVVVFFWIFVIDSCDCNYLS